MPHSLYFQSKWKKDGRTLTKSLKYSFSSAGSIFIANVNDFDSGRYECTVTNDFGRVTASCVVSVRYVKVFYGEDFLLEKFLLPRMTLMP